MQKRLKTSLLAMSIFSGAGLSSEGQDNLIIQASVSPLGVGAAARLPALGWEHARFLAVTASWRVFASERLEIIQMDGPFELSSEETATFNGLLDFEKLPYDFIVVDVRTIAQLTRPCLVDDPIEPSLIEREESSLIYIDNRRGDLAIVNASTVRDAQTSEPDHFEIFDGVTRRTQEVRGHGLARTEEPRSQVRVEPTFTPSADALSRFDDGGE